MFGPTENVPFTVLSGEFERPLPEIVQLETLVVVSETVAFVPDGTACVAGETVSVGATDAVATTTL